MFILPVVPLNSTVDLIPDPVPPAVKSILAEFAAPAETGNVYVSLVSAGNVTVLVFTELRDRLRLYVIESIAVNRAP